MTNRDFRELLNRYVEGDVIAAEMVESMRCEPELTMAVDHHRFRGRIVGKQLAFLAAGPVEDLITDFGSDFVERIETAARRETVMRSLFVDGLARQFKVQSMGPR